MPQLYVREFFSFYEWNWGAKTLFQSKQHHFVFCCINENREHKSIEYIRQKREYICCCYSCSYTGLRHKMEWAVIKLDFTSFLHVVWGRHYLVNEFYFIVWRLVCFVWENSRSGSNNFKSVCVCVFVWAEEVGTGKRVHKVLRTQKQKYEWKHISSMWRIYNICR